ncbi:MAG: CoA transferase [Dehalococcoidia bacterium]|nr:MAG: CoA transferase [Dehalococcoidia bacterium]
MTAPPMAGPLTGVRGIVLTQAWAGNWCTSLLGQMGADVIQIEVRKRPDNWRGDYDATMAPMVRQVPTAKHPWNNSALYNSICLNKRCITLDLGTPDGLSIFKRLLPFADFVAENFSPRVLDNFGIGYEAMCVVKPDIVLASLSSYGHSGPWANVLGIGGTIEPTSGQSALLGYVDGPPLNSGQMYPDPVAAVHGVLGIVAALRHRDRTGEGQYIDLSMHETSLSFIGDAALEFAITGQQRPRMGNRHLTFAPHGVYRAVGREQWVAIGCEDDAQWEALARVAGHVEWLADPRFATMAGRKQHEDALDTLISHWLTSQERDAVVHRLLEGGVIAAPVLDSIEVAQDAHLRARGFLRDIVHPESGQWVHATLPMHFSRTPADKFRPAPLQGEHTYEVLQELLGMPAAEVDELVRSGVSGMGPPD